MLPVTEWACSFASDVVLFTGDEGYDQIPVAVQAFLLSRVSGSITVVRDATFIPDLGPVEPYSSKWGWFTRPSRDLVYDAAKLVIPAMRPASPMDWTG